MDERKPAIPKSQEKLAASRALVQRIDERMKQVEIKDDAALCQKARLKRYYLNGVRRLREPGLFSAAALARALECSIDYLAGESDVAAVPLDEKRFIRVVLAVMKMVAAGTLVLKPEEAAELTFHVYNHQSARDDDGGALADAIIEWLSTTRHGPS